MKSYQIDRKTMDLIRELEAQLQSFHGMRHLWAELVANHIDCGVPKEHLERQQCDRLTAALGVAFTLAKEMKLSWCIEVSEGRKFKDQIANLSANIDVIIKERIGMVAALCEIKSFSTDADSQRMAAGALK